ncbi:hypothetical protein FEM08_06300 [Flavobacterium gilvum]|nr:hypothetical protein FEM08_06300 [Flavobacterium gilvum]
MVNPLKAFIIEAKGIRASELIGPIPIDIGNLVPRNIFSVNKDIDFSVFLGNKTIVKL